MGIVHDGKHSLNVNSYSSMNFMIHINNKKIMHKRPTIKLNFNYWTNQARTQDFQKGGFYLEAVGDPSCGGLGAVPPAADKGVIIDIL